MAPVVASVVAAFRYLDIEVVAEGAAVRHTASGELISVYDKTPGSEVNQIVVMERVSVADAQGYREAGIGWLDLTGHLSYRSPSLVIDADVPGRPAKPSQRRTAVLAGAVVSGVTIAALAAWPEPLLGVRSTARLLDVTAGGVSAACIRLQKAGLLTADRRATSALFWAAAQEWRPTWTDLPIDSLPLITKCVAVGAVAASAVGAPALVTSTTIPEFLVDNHAIIELSELSAITSKHGQSGPIGRFAVAPAPVATQLANKSQDRIEGYAIAADATVALVLATDPARGAETVRSWQGDHVWNQIHCLNPQ